MRELTMKHLLKGSSGDNLPPLKVNVLKKEEYKKETLSRLSKGEKPLRLKDSSCFTVVDYREQFYHVRKLLEEDGWIFVFARPYIGGSSRCKLGYPNQETLTFFEN